MHWGLLQLRDREGGRQEKERERGHGKGRRQGDIGEKEKVNHCHLRLAIQLIHDLTSELHSGQ